VVLVYYNQTVVYRQLLLQMTCSQSQIIVWRNSLCRIFVHSTEVVLLNIKILCIQFHSSVAARCNDQQVARSMQFLGKERKTLFPLSESLLKVHLYSEKLIYLSENFCFLSMHHHLLLFSVIK
jgi:hypothetical protein